ncbi:MAG: hypothetical protein QM569_11420 [Acidovorax sp.]|uniref:Vgb family protein n=1 Tax=Acidovorax sp. TaxID=1872122 RepID=UPI0039E25A99
MHAPLRRIAAAAAFAAAGLLAACSTTTPTRPAAWAAPEVLVKPSAFAGVHGLAVDKQGRLLAGSVAGANMWEVNRQTGEARVFIEPPQGMSDDIAISAKGEMAWTGFNLGQLFYRAHDKAPIQVLAKDLPGINSLDFDKKTGQLYASQVFAGDALWEIDRAGKKPQRLIKKDMGGFNGFEVGPDGMLYGPLWFKNKVVRINPANGDMTTIADGFAIPAAANLDGKGNLWVLDTRRGELVKVELATGRKTVATQLKTGLDNLAIAPDDGTIYISNMADNSVQAFNPATGALRTLTSGAVALPTGLKADGDRLWVADVFAFREVDLKTGQVSDIFRAWGEGELEYPLAVGMSKTRFALASFATNSVQVVDRATRKTQVMAHGFKVPLDAIPLDDGSVLVLELGTGSIVRASGDKLAERKTIASGIKLPVQMVLGRDGQVYVTDLGGSLLRVPAAGGTPVAVAQGLNQPEGLAETPWGTFIVAEVGAKRLTEVNLADGSRRTVADKLPIGVPPLPGGTPANAPTGVTVGGDGSVYFSSDVNNGIYRIRPAK